MTEIVEVDGLLCMNKGIKRTEEETRNEKETQQQREGKHKDNKEAKNQQK